MSRRPTPTGLDWAAVTASYEANGGVVRPEVWGIAVKKIKPAAPRTVRSVKPRAVKPRNPRLQSAPRTSNNPLGRGATVLLTRDEMADIISRYTSGEGMPTIAKSHGIGRNTAAKLLRAAGIQIRASGCPLELSADQIDELKARYTAGETFKELAASTGTAQRTLGRTLIAAGLQPRSKSEARALAGQRKAAG